MGDSIYKTLTTLSPEIFRAYDIRGIVDKTLTTDGIYTLGKAIASEAYEKGEKQIVIGRDGRLSGQEFLNALSQAIIDTGLDVINIGAVPTPVLYFATKTIATSGIMLTGSHNPPNYNGLKSVVAGKTLSDNAIQDLYQRIINQQFHDGLGKSSPMNILSQYIFAIQQRIHLKRKLKIVIDCGNGITGNIAPYLFQQLGCDVVELFCDVDGHFPNHEADPSQPENLQDLITAVLQHKADIGLAFDGDGDRLGVVTNRGEIIWPDRQLMLFAKYVLKNNPGSTIIFDVKCSNHLRRLIENEGGKALMVQTGHSFIKNHLLATNAPLAGEMSGHLFFNDDWFGFDDGLYAAARLLQILANEKQSISDIFSKLPDSINTPELKLAVTEEQKFQLMQQLVANSHFDQATISTIDGIRADFQKGWGLIRASNTTPYLVLRFEADSHDELQRIKGLFKKQLASIAPSLDLKGLE